MTKTCCNPAHSKEQPIIAEYVLVDRKNQPHFLCDPCACILDDLGNLDTFIQELSEWEDEQLTPEERKARDWAEYGDMEYHRQKDEGEL